MISAFFASNAAVPEAWLPPVPWSLSRIAAVEAENWWKLGAPAALLFAGNVDICADHTGGMDADGCGVWADMLADAPIVFGAQLLAARLYGGFGGFILLIAPLRLAN